MPSENARVVILGAGFGGFYTAYHLQRLTRAGANLDVTLISRENYFTMTPLLFEAGSGVLEPRHAVNPIRPMFNRVRFITATVESVDLQRQTVVTRHRPENELHETPYDHLVFALGGVTNRKIIPGSEHALGFKTLAEAIYLRNHTIDLFERASIESDPAKREKLLHFVIIGAGLVGVELMGELTEFVPSALRHYDSSLKALVKFTLIEAGPNLLPEMDRELAAYAVETLQARGVTILASTPVQKIDEGRVHLPDGRAIESATIILAAGVAANPLLNTIPLEKKKGRLVVEATMRSKQDPRVWALGDCAVIPDPSGKPYPMLAQHALREAKVLAGNIAAAARGEEKLQPFVYSTRGTLAALGHYSGVGMVMGIKLRGFIAWWVWRTYYLMQMVSFDRKVRVVLDWTTALFFKNDVVKMELPATEHPGDEPPKIKGD